MITEYRSASGTLYSCSPIVGAYNAVLLRDGERAIVGKWKNQTLEAYEGHFIEPPLKGRVKYRFKYVSCQDIQNDPGPNRDIFEKIGYVFFKLDCNRLRNSSVQVQEQLLLGLLSRNYWASETSHVEYAVEDMPGYTKKAMHYFLLLEKKTQEVAGAVFAKLRKNGGIKIYSLSMGEKYRSQGLGGLFFTTALRRLQRDFGYSYFCLHASKESVQWYPKFGFSKVDQTAECRDFTLSLKNKKQKRLFEKKERQIRASFYSPTIFQKVVRVAQAFRFGLTHLLRP